MINHIKLARKDFRDVCQNTSNLFWQSIRLEQVVIIIRETLFQFLLLCGLSQVWATPCLRLTQAGEQSSKRADNRWDFDDLPSHDEHAGCGTSCAFRGLPPRSPVASCSSEQEEICYGQEWNCIPRRKQSLTSSYLKIRWGHASCERHAIFHALWLGLTTQAERRWTGYTHYKVLLPTLISHILRRLTGPTSFDTEQTKRWTIRTMGLSGLVQSYEEGMTGHSRTLCVLGIAVIFWQMSFQHILRLLWEYCEIQRWRGVQSFPYECDEHTSKRWGLGIFLVISMR